MIKSRSEPPDLPPRPLDLSDIVTPEEIGNVRCDVEGRALFLEGHVPSYEVKCKIESRLREAGYEVQNHLRVTPRIASVASLPPIETPSSTRPASSP
jgi:hypothetical protein